MKYIILLLLFISCKAKDEVKKIEIKTVSKDLFTTTQQYEISCWIIKVSEGYSSKPYYCSAGKKTVGYGFCTVKSVKNIHHADIIFKEIKGKLAKKVDVVFPKLNYLQKSAITSLLYNTGNLDKIKNSGFSKALEDKNIDKAVSKFKKWCKIKVNGKVIILKGLQNRRTYESKLLNNSFTMKDYIELKKRVTQIYILNKTK